MTLLSHVNRSIGAGRIELHFEDGRFETRLPFDDALTGETLVSRVPQDAESARRWYELAEETGAVHAEFPFEDAVAP
jgi:hypothetical protein